MNQTADRYIDNDVRISGRADIAQVSDPWLCGVAGISGLDVLPDLIGVAVGCFTDPGFDAPHTFF